MLKKFLRFIETHQLFETDDKLLVAVSGGVDSMVLLHLLFRGKYHAGIAHCNFQLRGTESDGDESFVKAKAAAYDFPFYLRRFDTQRYAREQGVSIQMAARELRYGWFRQLADDGGYGKIVTAHHLNDSLETALLNFTKGTGVAGLRGMAAKSPPLVRPLLCFTRQEVEAYADRHRIAWREDSSNSSEKYQRNLIRHRITPVLKAINPSLEHTFGHTTRRLRSLERLLTEAVRKEQEKTVKQGDDVMIPCKRVLNMEIAVLEVLLKKYGLNWDQTVSIRACVSAGEVGKVFYGEGCVLNVDRSAIIISPERDNVFEELTIPSDGEYVYPFGKLICTTSDRAGAAELPRGKETAFTDFDLLTFPLTLRLWRPGDTFQPLGMKGRKKLSDFMIDAKIPLNLKKRVAVITSDGHIIWVVGHRIDDRYKVSDKTEKVFRILKND